MNQYFEGLQKQWVDHFKKLGIVTTKSGFKTVSQVTLLAPELFNKTEYFECIYYLLEKLFETVPSKDTIKSWSLFIWQWKYDEATFATNDDIAKKINGSALNDFDNGKLKKYYEYLLSEKRTDLFTDNQLLPNIDGKFQYLGTLKQARDLTAQLIRIGGRLIPDALAQLINDDFAFDFRLDAYGRRDFSNSVNTTLGTQFNGNFICLPESYTTEDYVADVEGTAPSISRDYFLEVLLYCKLHTSIDSQSKPSKLMSLISEYYHVDASLVQLDALADKENDIDIRGAQKWLVKVFFNTLERHNESWVANNLDTLLQVAQLNEDRYRECYSTSRIYPNQLFRLCLLTGLKKALNTDAELGTATNLDSDLIQLYDNVCGTSIKGVLANIRFNDFLIDNEVVINKTLSTAIEAAFFDTDVQDMKHHRFKDEILSIISKLNTSFYRELFPRLNDKKALLILDLVTNEAIKDDIFLIVTLKDEQLNKLGKIVQLPNFDKVLLQAENALLLEKERESNFLHKYKIGTYIEDKIREVLGAALSSKLLIEKDKNVSTEDVQGGRILSFTTRVRPFTTSK